ncbi:MAG: Hpt domain-containing protein [Corallococcus sp.]|nr:Hpt domain-containing protein [Bacillota bacterium]MCM1533924.1 Hpt domain-containing protein [Corallococcus sp.]
MTVEKFYETICGDYAGTKARLMTDERIARFVNKFPADGSYQLLVDSIASGNVQDAFRAAHTIKGVAQNLGFTLLYKSAEEVTEILRAGSLDVAAHMPELEKNYKLTIESIGQIDA